MALIIKDRVKETTLTSGTVPFICSGAIVEFQSFSSAIGDANTTLYAAEDIGGINWEVGVGQYVLANNSLLRATILASSNNNNIVNFSSGSKNLFVTVPAAYAALTGRDLSQFALTTSANLLSIITDETGSGQLVFSNNAVLSNTTLGTANGKTLFLTNDLRAGNVYSNGQIVLTSEPLAQAAYDTANTKLNLTGGTITGPLTVNSNVAITGANVSLGNVSSLHIYGGNTGQLLTTDNLGNLSFIDLPTPDTITYTANSLIQTNGVYVSGNLWSTQVYGDYSANNGVYVLTDGSGSAPAWNVDFDFINVDKFNRVVMNINYTQSSGHTVYVQLYNNNTSAWDNIGTYTGLGSYYAFALEIIDDFHYVNSGRVQLKLYHSNAGNIAHQTSIDYVALEQSFQGPQGPRGPTGSTGPTGSVGAGVAIGGVAGQILIKTSATDYDTSWVDNGAYAKANAAYDQANTKFSSSGGTVSGSVIITNDLSISGNVYILGSSTTVKSNTIVIDDPVLYIANNNPANINDIGLVGHFTSTQYQHTGLVRDASDGVWKLFSNVVPEFSNNTVDFSNAIYDTLKVGNTIGGLYGNSNTATVLQTARLINGTSFDGSASITIPANTFNVLTIGTGFNPGTFNGSSAVTLTANDASTTLAGIVQLTDSISSNSTTTAATPNSIKIAYDQATNAYNSSNTKFSANGGTITGNVTITDTLVANNVNVSSVLTLSNTLGGIGAHMKYNSSQSSIDFLFY
jgi:hypothetical protein